jgi:MarR family transcriptional regulator for hemolysin
MSTPATETTQPVSQDQTSLPPLSGDARLEREYGFTYRVILCARRYRALLDEQLRPLGYGTARMEALSTIHRSPEPSAQIAIAKRIGIEGPTLTRMLDALEAEGLVVRRADPTDRRTKLIELTDAGRKAHEEITAVAHAFRHTVLKDLTDTELDTVNAITGRLLTSLTQSQG